MTDYVIEQHQVDCIDMTQKKYISYDQHPWGPFYVHYTKDYYQDLFTRLIELSNEEIDKVRIIVFGTGSCAEEFMSQIDDKKVAIQCFVDNNKSKHNTLFFGLDVISPDKLPDKRPSNKSQYLDQGSEKV